MKRTKKLSGEINVFILLFLLIVLLFQAITYTYCLRLVDDKKNAWKGAITRDINQSISRNIDELTTVHNSILVSEDIASGVGKEDADYYLAREKIYGYQEFIDGTIHACVFTNDGEMKPVSGNISDEETENVKNSFLLYMDENQKEFSSEYIYYSFFEFDDGEYHNTYFVSLSPIFGYNNSGKGKTVEGHLCTFTLVEMSGLFSKYDELSDVNITLKTGAKESMVLLNGRNTNQFLLTEKWTGEKVPETNWHTDGSITLAVGKFDWTTLLFMFILESLLLILIIFIFRFRLKRNTIEPLKAIGKFMRFFRISDSFKPLDIQGNSELVELSGEINKMVKRNKTLANDIMTKQGKLYEVENMKNEATLYALQNQVNPHYLYNIFELIRSIALVRGVSEIETISVNVSEIFRYNLKQESVAKLSDEYDIMKRYVSIMQVKYGESFEVEYDLAPETLDKKIMKMIFQPIIENAFGHGYVRRKEKFCVKVRSWMENDTLCISFYDNGLGMTAERLCEVREKIREDKMASGKGIGIANLAHRLKMMYGESHTFNIESEKDKFTKIVITINM